MYLLQLLQTLHEPPILDICAFVREFQAFKFQLIFLFLLSPEESLFNTTVLKESFEVHPDLITKELRPTHFSPKQSFLLKGNYLSLALW